MIRIKVMIFALLFAILGQPIAAIASDVTNALYSGTIVISNNSTANTNVSTTANISTDNLIADDFLNATANNTVMRNSSGADVPFMPGYTDANLWSMWVKSIGANSYLTYILYTANSTGGEIRYFPGSTGMTTLDSAGLELLGGTTNFSIIQSGWFDTSVGVNKALVLKPGAIRIDISSSTAEQIDVKVVGIDTDCLDYVAANNDWTRVPDDDAFSFTDGALNDKPFTIIAWVNPDDVVLRSILTKRTAAGPSREWWFYFDAGGLLELFLEDPTDVNQIWAESVALAGDAGVWHHYAATYDASEVNTGIEVFRDGVNATNARGSAGAYVGMSNTAAVVEMGSQDAGTGQYMNGLMAEIKVYGAELTEAEILADFNGQHRSADLVAWWKIDEGIGLPQDSSGNGHDANQNLADWVETFTERYSTETYASAVDADEHVVEVAMEDEPTMALWAADVNVGVNMGNGILPVKLIEEQTLTAAAASVTFTDIGTKVALWDSLAGVTSRHLVVMVNAASDDVAGSVFLGMRFNGDAGANYNYQRIFAQNVAVNPSRTTDTTNMNIGWTSAAGSPNQFDGSAVLIPHAFNTTNDKSILSLGGQSEGIATMISGRWAVVNAITSLELFPSAAGDYIAGSTFLLGVIDERYLVEEQLLTVAGAIDFQNIPADGHDLVVIGYSQSDAAAVEDEILHEINNDGGAAAYPCQELTARALVAAASQPAGDEIGMTSGDDADANEFGAFFATYSQYSESTNFVHFTSLSGYHESTIPTSEVRAMSGRWATVDAIMRLEFYPATAPNQFLPGTLFSLYRVPRYVISRQELTVATPTITFTNIPQEYQALQLNVYARSDLAAINEDVEITLNTDGVAANYDWQYLEGIGAGPPTALRNLASQILMAIPAANEGGNEFGGGTVTLPRYERTDGHKHLITLSGTQENQVIIRSSRWEDLTAITRIDLDLAGANNFVAGSVFELVGLMPTKVIYIDVDGDIKGLADGNFAIPDTADDWTFVEAAAMPYMEYQEITVAGTLQQDIVWEYDSVFHDTSHYGVGLDGLNDRIHMADDPTLDSMANLTVEMWVRLDRLGSVAGFVQTIIEKSHNVAPWYSYKFDITVGDVVRGRVINNIGVAQIGTFFNMVGGDVGEWHHLVMTYDGVNIVLYHNGTPSAPVAQNGAVFDSNSPLYIGETRTAGQPLQGQTDEIRIYARELSQAEVTYNYNAGVGIYTPYDITDLVGWWHLEEGSGLSAFDSSGNGNTGTLQNGALWVNGHVPLPFGTSGTNDATPSFRTASSDPNVSANMTSFLPISQAQAPAYALGPVNPFISGTGNVTGNFTIVPPPGTFPLAGVIAAVANATATPSQLPLLIIACFVILAASLTTTYLLRKYGSGSLLVKAFVIIGVMGIFIALGDFGIDFWMLLVFGILATALAMMSRQVTWQ